jgi:hypothetical protein
MDRSLIRSVLDIVESWINDLGAESIEIGERKCGG